eukprot:NODE_2831_length_859_cov_67.490123_g2341_i0.p1 GENE.NODE_2831_length_859_cov_67.490123_g2341_i0~~NODE_2831_length_859_cov_67.490123_g2341_i0.p1  ORF type:complete len:209 (-),score=80.35 NODE_2831_length_859_cov_67.490123_g2341_i0:231-836(-)
MGGRKGQMELMRLREDLARGQQQVQQVSDEARTVGAARAELAESLRRAETRAEKAEVGLKESLHALEVERSASGRRKESQLARGSLEARMQEDQRRRIEILERQNAELQDQAARLSSAARRRQQQEAEEDSARHSRHLQLHSANTTLEKNVEGLTMQLKYAKQRLRDVVSINEELSQHLRRLDPGLARTLERTKGLLRVED